MCGIAGIYAFSEGVRAPAESEILAMRDHMAARGPDGAGLWWNQDRRMCLAHRRLSIIDLSDRAAQPMSDSSGRFSLTFNGEIYNYRAIRQLLESKGHRFRTDSDTEVLLQLYADKGEDMVRDLRGMFAFALWDGVKRELFLARDPYGIKPLYYADGGGSFRFASQVKALAAGNAISREVDSAGLAGFALFGSVPEPFTIYRAVKALPAGTTMRVHRNGASAPKRFFSVAEIFAGAEKAPAVSLAEAKARAADALSDSVAHHLVADVPVGLFLSAGIDSGALAGLASGALRKKNQALETITLAFDEFHGRPDDEAPQAARVAQFYHCDHSERRVGQEEFEADLPRLLAAMDQPTIDGVNTWFVAKAAKERGLKVALSGLGGDELFGGYPSFRDLPRWVNMLSWSQAVPALGPAVRKAFAMLGGTMRGMNVKMAGMLEYGGHYPGAYLLRRGLFMPWELEGLLGRDVAEEGLSRLQPLEHIAAVSKPEAEESFGRVATLEASLYMRNQLLRDTDWASMAHSLEVRAPLVDSVLLTSLASLLTHAPREAGKSWLAESPSPPLPAEIVSRPKTGFLTPVGMWLEHSSVARKTNFSEKIGTAKHKSQHWSRRWALAVLDQFGGTANSLKPAAAAAG